MEAAGFIEIVLFIYQVTLWHIIMIISILTGLQYLNHQVCLEIAAVYCDSHYGEVEILFL
jgi:hypothetical protein